MKLSFRLAVVTHGGVGAAERDKDGTERAACHALDKLKQGATALQAAVAGATILEDDPRFNAGTGSNLRYDGQTIEMDAAVMVTDGRSGAVANLVRVKNPVLVAAEVLERTPHILLAGAGALTFARGLGFADHDPVVAREAHAKRATSDTIGVVVRRGPEDFAAAVSTGGTERALLGRIGDTPLIGCGLYAGPCGAVATTGIGEEIVRRFLAKTVYDWMVGGLNAQEACDRGVALFPTTVEVGVIAVGRASEGRAANRAMPSGLAI